MGRWAFFVEFSVKRIWRVGGGGLACFVEQCLSGPESGEPGE